MGYMCIPKIIGYRARLKYQTNPEITAAHTYETIVWMESDKTNGKVFSSDNYNPRWTAQSQETKVFFFFFFWRSPFGLYSYIKWEEESSGNILIYTLMTFHWVIIQLIQFSGYCRTSICKKRDIHYFLHVTCYLLRIPYTSCQFGNIHRGNSVIYFSIPIIFCETISFDSTSHIIHIFHLVDHPWKHFSYIRVKICNKLLSINVIVENTTKKSHLFSFIKS